MQIKPDRKPLEQCHQSFRPAPTTFTEKYYHPTCRCQSTGILDHRNRNVQIRWASNAPMLQALPHCSCFGKRSKCESIPNSKVKALGLIDIEGCSLHSSPENNKAKVTRCRRYQISDHTTQLGRTSTRTTTFCHILGEKKPKKNKNKLARPFPHNHIHSMHTVVEAHNSQIPPHKKLFHH